MSDMSLINKKEFNKADFNLEYFLGGTSMLNFVITSDFDLIKLSNDGITKGSLEALVSHLGVSRKAFAEDILNISVKTIERKKADHKFDKRTSSHIIEIAKVLEHAFRVFETEEKVQLWLSTPNSSLNNLKPIDIFNTPTGLHMVNSILGRIEEGVFS